MRLLFLIYLLSGSVFADDNHEKKFCPLLIPGHQCNSSLECGPMESCINHTCQFFGGAGCLSDVDCPIGEHCVNRECKP